MRDRSTTGSRLGVVLAIYLLGLLIGGLYVGMISPARTVIQADFGIGDTTGIWMINIYTLFYAALIPVVGKIGDRRGRKRVLLGCMGIFCAGALVCGLSQNVGGFALLLAGRVLQAVGAAGTIPVANAEIGTVFPPERRGSALAIAAVVAGVANVFGAVAGSAVVGIFGTGNWQMMFYLCIPFCLAVIVAGHLLLPDSPAQRDRGPMDVAGSVLFAAFVLLLLMGLKDIDFTAPGASLADPGVWAPLLAAVVALAAFRQVERNAADPVFHLEYLRSRPIVVTMAASFFIGCFIVSMVMVPQMAEFALDAPLGSGGYYVLAIGLMSFVTTPVGGKLIDKVGPKPVLLAGLGISIAGLLYLALAALAAPSLATMVAGLLVVGAGMGLSMGAPTNYMILENVGADDATSAVASIALVRQIGTSIAPAIYVGVLASLPGLAGYQGMLLCVAAFNACALLAMLFYRSPERA